MKEFPGGVLVITGANSAVGLRSMPVRFLFLDEVDGYPGDAGGEGDPVALAMQRAVTFMNRKVLMVSTPTVKGFSRIEHFKIENTLKGMDCRAASPLAMTTPLYSDNSPAFMTTFCHSEGRLWPVGIHVFSLQKKLFPCFPAPVRSQSIFNFEIL